ncbi:FAD-dependent oxidoreductase (GlcD/DLD_GlcF/GlpC domain fusion protein) [Natrialba magadii ATCC 43099]|uniref:D-lactate dehydrogenase (cytochrome) n=1 Tax=Natrialba magadii (strain ATCC 43099 / DSM 3394 / CCM 3739 / CIP 104546 / IAM 13178 / JCM 8861 / NBRC 102185 / NCIMB 2190 / MS3) TaxID=547559 RepID=D3T0H0_NATMM|nr:FAD-binding and (Fe-S)-binding domain-containing protein [Natrialba magadii]ADD06449.1 FAD-dependent oxidoreductase (GlcD/DLD_GlcF/GlpC domain fusion protein) [Natrialba magadii ATCC 43099]ELY31664.1 D-lactate dehydrogenase [Natrialba magadii ATCC 43099]
MSLEPSVDPAADRRATYDYQSSDVDRPALVDDLTRLVDCDVRADSYSRQLYATDASAYEVTPIAVAFPESTADVSGILEYCAEREIPVLPRGGGTSLAGQTVNRAVVLDFTRHMNAIREIDLDGETATVQPGTVLGTLNETLSEHDLKFAPDPAWGDKSAIGGAIGNNSTGSHSLKYGKTDAYIEACEVVLADGTVTEFGEVTREEIDERADPEGDLEARIYAEVAHILDEKADLVDEAYPNLKRNVSGYNLDRLVAEDRGADLPGGETAGDTGDPGSVNLARLLAGSEGTLAVVTEATVSLEPVPETKAVSLLCYPDLHQAMEDVAPILEHSPAAVEVLDDVLLDLARDTAEFGPVAEMLPEGTNAVLLVEFYAEDMDHGREQVAGLFADRCPDATAEGEPAADAPTTDADRHAIDGLEAYEKAERAKLWKLRKSGLPILLSRTTDEKHISFIEDTAIPPAKLPEFVERFETILEEHDTYASFYAHAGPGVLHVRPLLNTKTDFGLDQLHGIADDVTDLVVELGGSVSGEHGDGRARTQWNRKLYGEELWETFQDLKTAFDPNWILNPGQVVFREENPTDLRENLRFDPDYDFEADFEPTLEWQNDNGMQGMVELCHGCGGCRGEQETTGGVMCPTYRASQEEITATRGRANALRQAMSGGMDADEATSDEFVEEVMDLCIGCKGCAIDCPSEVDMAKLKAEVTHEYHQRNGASLRDRLFANVATLSRWGSRLAPLSNAMASIPGARTLLEATVGIDSKRPIPTFEPVTFRTWFQERGGAHVPETEAEHKAVVYPDTYTNYSNPAAGKAAVRVLEAAGVHVTVPDELDDTGRPAFSKGFLEKARKTARENVATLSPLVADGWDVVVIEPSDAVMFQSDYLDLLSSESAKRLAGASYGVCEYLDVFRLDDAIDFASAAGADGDSAPSRSLTYHGHCHQKATKKDHHAVGVLRRAGYEVDPLDSGCCGMAGSFGYEAEHASMSDAIAEILFDQVDDSDGDRVVAPGASCRSQLEARSSTDEKPPTPIELVEQELEN